MALQVSLLLLAQLAAVAAALQMAAQVAEMVVQAVGLLTMELKDRAQQVKATLVAAPQEATMVDLVAVVLTLPDKQHHLALGSAETERVHQ
jgi:hypothetical protein